MNWEAFGAIAEMFGALGVIATLVYLALQIRQSNRQDCVKGLQDAVAHFVDNVLRSTATRANAEVFRKGLHGFKDMPELDQAQFHSMLLRLAAGFNQVRILHESGLLHRSKFEAMEYTMTSIMRSPGALEWWNSWKHNVPVSLEDCLDGVISDVSILARPASEHWIGFTSEAG